MSLSLVIFSISYNTNVKLCSFSSIFYNLYFNLITYFFNHFKEFIFIFYSLQFLNLKYSLIIKFYSIHLWFFKILIFIHRIKINIIEFNLLNYKFLIMNSINLNFSFATLIKIIEILRFLKPYNHKYKIFSIIFLKNKI